MDDMNAHTGSHDMDEITLVRAVLAPPPPPRPQVTARARQRLAGQIEAAGLPARPAAGEGAIREPVSRLAPRAPRRSWRSPRLRWATAITGVAAASLAGALAVALLTGGAGGQPGLIASERPLGTLTGRPASPYLLAMATRVAAASPTTGKYWCQTMVAGQLDPIGPGGRELTPHGQGLPPSPVSDYRYSIFARQVQVDCLDYSKKPSGSIGGYYNALARNLGGSFQDLGARPATARDAAAWRQDGSPAWHAWYVRQIIAAHPGPRIRASGKPGSSPGQPIPLPTDPAKLRAVLLAHQGSSGISASPEEILFGQLRQVLLAPATPALRAAVYQVMAGIPGIQMKPGVRDPSGRPGTAVWLGNHPDGAEIVDPATGMLLADEFIASQPHGVYAPGTVTQYFLWQHLGWANRIPR
jgi:hypothetical protein